MITPDYCRTMARYNAWQNRSLYTAADGLSEEARRADRGAFFGSIHGTLSHLLWADRMWMARLADWEAPKTLLSESPRMEPDWERLRVGRDEADAALTDWADALSEDDLAGDLSWYSGSLGRDQKQPVAGIVMHLFNHQTHHRGQVHAMLTAAGASPEPTDLFIMIKRD